MLAASKCTTESLWIHILKIISTLKIFFDVDCSSAVASRLPFSLLFLSVKLLQCNYTVTVDETHLCSIGSLYSKSFLFPNTSVPFLPMLLAQLLCATLPLQLAPHIILRKLQRTVTEMLISGLALNSNFALWFSFSCFSALELLIPCICTLTGNSYSYYIYS